MARPKRVHPVLPQARAYLKEHAPELADAPLHIRQLDGPPGSPRYAATVERCTADECPFGVATEVAREGRCDMPNCQLRETLRLLFDRDGKPLEVQPSHHHWSP
jgi:hypothetical protein